MLNGSCSVDRGSASRTLSTCVVAFAPTSTTTAITARRGRPRASARHTIAAVSSANGTRVGEVRERLGERAEAVLEAEEADERGGVQPGPGRALEGERPDADGGHDEGQGGEEGGDGTQHRCSQG